jgi:hypothetical protein
MKKLSMGFHQGSAFNKKIQKPEDIYQSKKNPLGGGENFL